MNPAPFDRPERQAAAGISAEGKSDLAGASGPGPDENTRPTSQTVAGRQGEPPAEQDDDDEYVPL